MPASPGPRVCDSVPSPGLVPGAKGMRAGGWMLAVALSLIGIGLTACEELQNFDPDVFVMPDPKESGQAGDSLNPNLVVVDANPGVIVTPAPRVSRSDAQESSPEDSSEVAEATSDGHNQPISLIDAELSQWASAGFGADGEIWVDEAGLLHLGMGGPLTGLRYTGDLEALLGESLDAYEIRLEASRLDGHDFFVGLTFPVGIQGHVTLIMGGWAGAVTGLSSLDGRDASDNRTTQIIRYENEQWYEIRVRVTPELIAVWVDDAAIIEVPRADHETFSVRPEVLNTIPLGLSAFQTHAAIRAFTIEPLVSDPASNADDTAGSTPDPNVVPATDATESNLDESN